MEEEIRRIAARVKRWRLDAGLTLQDVSDSSGVSASTVHKIENLQTVPTISVLLKVAHGLGRKPHELFDGGEGASSGRAALLRSEQREVLDGQAGSRLERVIRSIDGADIDLWRVIHQPGRGARIAPDAPRLSYPGELVILVDAGRLTVTVDGVEHALGPGDTLHFKTLAPHRWENRGDVVASAFFFALLPESARRLEDVRS